MTILGELQKQNAGAWWEGYELDATAQGGGVTFFHAGTNELRSPVVWQGNTYQPFPIEASGFEVSGTQLPRPKMRVANIGGVITSLLTENDLLGAKITRRRTMVKFLDDINFPIRQKPTPSVLTFTRASVATYFGSDGKIKTAAANVPRIEYDPNTLAVRGLLIEEQRTNYYNSSNSFIAGAGTSITPNAAIGIDGSLTASRYSKSDATTPRYQASATTLTVAANSTYTVSRFFKYDGFDTTVSLEYNSNANWGGVNWVAVFNVSSSGVSISSVNACTATVTHVGDGWHRVTATFTTGATISTPTNPQTLSRITGASGVSVQMTSAQIELGAFATSYIPTATIPVTRAADNAVVSNLSSIAFNALEGTVSGEARILASGNSGNKKSVFSLTTGNFNAEMRGVLFNASMIQFGVSTGGQQADLQASISGIAGFKFSAGYKENDFGLSTNGLSPLVDTSGLVTPSVNYLNIGCSPQTSSGTGNVKGDFLNGHIKNFRYYPRRLTNAELQTLSSGGAVADLPTFELDTSDGNLNVYTLAQWNPTADPNAHLSDEVYYIAQKTLENAVYVEFELGIPIDLEGVMIPRRQIISNLCMWKYRGEGCGYAGGAVADANDNPTSSMTLDRCSKKLSGCKLRFGENSELPYGGFPAAGLVRV